MNKKIIGIFLVTLLIATSVVPVLGIKTISSNNMIIKIESITTDYLELVLDSGDPEPLNMMDSYYEIYEGLHWKLTLIAYWNPPQPEKQICLWVDPDTLPAGAIFPECTCGYGSISGVLDWTPAPGQAGTYEIVFYIGENCYEPLGTNIVTVKVYPYTPDPINAYEIYEEQSWHIGVTAYWSPSQPERPICLWVDDYTLPEGATFTPECNCGYGQVTSDLYWTPYVCQSGIYTITFYAGETCGEYVFPFSIKVIVFSSDPNINIYQENYRLDDGYTKDSRNGLLELTYDTNPSVEVQYVNFYYNEQWKMKNVPVRSDSTIRSQTICIPFYLGVPDGEDVHMAEYGYEVTTTPQTSPPETIKIKEVLDKENTIYSGEDGADLEYTGITTNPIWHIDYNYTKAGFKLWNHIVNQECGRNECAPAAISNSLKMLKKAHPDKLSGLTDDPDSNNDDTDINTMKPVVDWNESRGAPKANVESPDAWWNKKKAFMDASDHYPITTEIMSNKSNFDYVIDEIVRCQDVELRVWGHVVWVSGMIKTADGKYILEVNHDTNQSNPNGGTQTELVQYDPSTNRFHGSSWVEGRRFHEPGFIESIFIIECPEEEEENHPPETPVTPDGETSGETGISYPYTTSTTDSDGDPVSYGWDFNGDNVVDRWTEYYPSGQEIETYHTWETRGTYNIKVKAKDTDDAESSWSAPLTVSMPKTYTNDLIIQLFQKILERFPYLNKILNQIIL